MTMKKFLMTGVMAIAMTGCVTMNIPEIPDLSKLPQLPEIPTVTVNVEQNMQRNQTFDSAYNFATTKSKIVEALKSKGMTVFAEIDHQQAAKNAGLSMQPATVIIFGNPKAGTPLMVKDPNFALQLPLKVLVTEVNGKTHVVINKTESLIAGSQIQYSDVENTLAKAELVIQSAIK